MSFLASLFVGKPLNILIVGLSFAALHIGARAAGIGSEKHPRAMLVVVAVWLLYALWEWLVATQSPEANIRVDLLLIWPLVAIISVWFTIRAFK